MNHYKLDTDTLLINNHLHVSPAAIAGNRLKAQANLVRQLRLNFEASKNLRIAADLPNADDPDFMYVRCLGERSAMDARAKFLEHLKAMETSLVTEASLIRETGARDYVDLGPLASFGDGTRVTFMGDAP
jgi:hypothetical protein